VRTILTSLLLTAPLLTSANDALSPSPLISVKNNLVINNRPLLKVNGKPISLMDVVKRMDLFLHERYPQFENSSQARFQFYNANWKGTLDDMVFTELMIADAEEKEIKVTDGDVRKEMEERFGPNVIGNLNTIGLSYEEARKIVHDELVVEKMTWFKVISRAQQSVAPQDIKGAYSSYVQANPPSEEWEYQVLTIRGDTADFCAKVAEQAAVILKEKESELSSLAAELKQIYAPSKKLTIEASKDYVASTKTISKEHLEIVQNLKPNEYSSPIKQMSRAAGGEVYRIFHLKKHDLKEPNPFNELHQEISGDLVNRAVNKERAAYKARLMEKYEAKELTSSIPPDYQPFLLQ